MRTPGKAVLRLIYFFKFLEKKGGSGALVPFPPGTKGLFYYHLAPGSPPQAGEIRFKECDSVQQFSSGEDLQVDTGAPWTLPLFNIVNSTPRRGYLEEPLLAPGLVDQELVADLQRLVRDSRRCKRLLHYGIALYEIDQPFVTDLHVATFGARLITRQTIQTFADIAFWPTLTRHSLRIPGNRPPFYGRVRARFELMNTPQDEERPILHLRILGIIKPIEHRVVQDFMPELRAAELLMYREARDSDCIPWSYSPLMFGNNYKVLVEFLKCRAADEAKFAV
ncbi:hypothetical protein M413DRAFT_27662 [Hebeloma cylindrosporum]|uniref:Uncharacterized protein n=1 Tax=Hebeloma cylindrosporum TaxID=76867 RepID=A0A0C2YJR9_HEBCY|nr:hypothetical protein M413DRAFT_27662 [Hebeloma cylindrosporum h7]